MSDVVVKNRKIFIAAMRSGEYKKGTTRTTHNGRPIIESIADEGYCAVGLMYSLFEPLDRRVALGLTNRQCSKIQNEWNDSPLTFLEIADLIEKEMFRDRH